MTGDEVTEKRIDLLRYYDKVRVRRWRYSGGGPWAEAHVTLGWLPDGRWWVEDVRDHGHAWVYAGFDPAQVRAAAQSRADQQMALPYEHGGRWEPTVATFEPGVLPARARQVPEWPPGYEPGG